MKTEELLEFLARDDTAIMAEQALEEEKRQTALLQEMLDAMRAPGMPNKNYVVSLDLSAAHEDEEVWNAPEGFTATGFTILAQEVEYWYAFEYGDRVRVPAGYVSAVAGHSFKKLLITHTETSSTTMEITIGGIKT